MKKAKILIVAIIALALVPTLFLLGYYNHKSTDNIPSLDIISQMSESEVNSILLGYNINQLVEVWGKPSAQQDNEYIWENENTTLRVNYNSQDKVTVTGFSTWDCTVYAAEDNTDETRIITYLERRLDSDYGELSFTNQNTFPVTVFILHEGEDEQSRTIQPNETASFTNLNKNEEYAVGIYADVKTGTEIQVKGLNGNVK